MGRKIELITQAQKKKIWVEAKKLGISKDGLYKLILDNYEKEHMSNLTKQEGIEIIDCFIELNEEEQNDKREGMITNSQEWKIDLLRAKLGWDIDHLNKFIKKYAHVEHINWLTLNGASNIIEGLKNIEKRTNEEKSDISRG
ncbi:MAG: regulatory protein GemA [Tepidibacter sp.]|uniref:phage protein GemA/Gp16 family protein n=1 Tax=Tepidibacter sp. TaxID=2529387 RepID=UPI0025DE0B13|nr:phage protein GemA/Gp16 family protein [Tepidibacter sp.]MCT4509912.1 regulatory protein GemA [Tepidibacter sp.]